MLKKIFLIFILLFLIVGNSQSQMKSISKAQLQKQLRALSKNYEEGMNAIIILNF